MYDLPSGKTPKEFEIALDMADMPFEYGAITWRAARSKKAIGHQLISGSRVVGWLCSSDSKDEVVVGPSAAAMLRRISHERRLRSSATEWTRNQFAAVARRIPQSIVDQRELAAFGILRVNRPFSPWNTWRVTTLKNYVPPHLTSYSLGLRYSITCCNSATPSIMRTPRG